MADVNGRLEPDYAKMEREWRDSMRRVLTEVQCSKLAWAIWNYYLDKEEPKLPKPAMLVFEAYRSQLDFRREKSIEQLTRNRAGKAPLIAEDSGEACEVLPEIFRNLGSSERLSFKSLKRKSYLPAIVAQSTAR